MTPPRLRVCRHRTCPVLGHGTWCVDHAREQEQYRGSRHERGYGADHVARRQAMFDVLMPGTPCPVCGLGMWVDQALDAGHSEDLRDNPHAVADRLEHAACNRAWRKGVST